MSPRARLIVAFVLSGLLASVTGCADLSRKERDSGEPVSDSWVATKLNSERSADGQVSSNHGSVRTSEGVLAASSAPDNGARATNELAQNGAPKSDLDMGQPMGHRSLPFFPIFAVRPW
jgi:hypothetical protein